MAIVGPFYNSTTRKLIAVFGTLFNNIVIYREDNNNQEQKRFLVPIAYGPSQKFLAMLQRDPDKTQKSSVTLPRISFEISTLSYDPTRKLNNLQLLKSYSDTTTKNLYVPAPYNIDFTLSIMAKYSEDAVKILEQILPFFKPEWVSSVKLLEDFPDLIIDIPIILNSISNEEVYEGTFEERRVVLWTLNFTMKAVYFGPTKDDSKVIKFVKINMHESIDSTRPSEIINIRPGLTANGEPTTDISESIPYQEINFEDDWATICYIEENND